MKETVANLGGEWYGASGWRRTGGAMKWRVMLEITGEDGAVTQHVVSEGERTGAGQPTTLGLTLTDGKATLAGVQRVLVRRRSTRIVVAVAGAPTAERRGRSRTTAPAGWCRRSVWWRFGHPASGPAAAAWPAGAA